MLTVGGTCAHPVHGLVAGHDHDIEAVARLFDGAERGLERIGEEWFLYAPELDDRLDDPSSMHEAAVHIVRRMTGAARAEGVPLRGALRAPGRYDGPDGCAHVVGIEDIVVLDAASVMVVGGAVGGVPVPPAGPGYLADADRSRELDEVLDLLGGPDKLSTFDLWKVLEIVREQVGGGDALLATNWITAEEYKSFKAVVHDPAVSGPDARHARHAPTNAQPMTLDDARGLVARLVREWRVTL